MQGSRRTEKFNLFAYVGLGVRLLVLNLMVDLIKVELTEKRVTNISAFPLEKTVLVYILGWYPKYPINIGTRQDLISHVRA